MPRTPHRWVLVPAVVAPVALIGGWTWAAARQPPGYSAVSQTISALAARDATDRWIMTAGLAVLGLAHVGTALGLGGSVHPAARATLAAGGLATLAVSVFPQPAGNGSSVVHVGFATVGFVALTLWVPFALDRRAAWPLRAPATAVATVGLAGLLVVFGLTLESGVVGVTERLLAAAQALWPLVVAVAVVAAVRPRVLGLFRPRRLEGGLEAHELGVGGLVLGAGVVVRGVDGVGGSLGHGVDGLTDGRGVLVEVGPRGRDPLTCRDELLLQILGVVHVLIVPGQTPTSPADDKRTGQVLLRT